MPLVSDAQLDALRAVGYQNLDTDALVERPTEVETDFGTKESYSVVGHFPCWIRGMRASPVGVDMYSAESVGLFRIHFRFDADIHVNDRITINGHAFLANDLNDDDTLRIFTTAISRRVE